MINSYLTFNGNCRQAMTFYKKCLGGKLTFQTLGKSPLADEMPLKMKNCILHSELRNENFILMGSDIVSEDGMLKGNNVSLLLNCNNEGQAQKIYKALAKGCKQKNPIEITFWGGGFGTLTDKFGIHWMFNYENK